jgi:hypothetical protein
VPILPRSKSCTAKRKTARKLFCGPGTKRRAVLSGVFPRSGALSTLRLTAPTSENRARRGLRHARRIGHPGFVADERVGCLASAECAGAICELPAKNVETVLQDNRNHSESALIKGILQIVDAGIHSGEYPCVGIPGQSPAAEHSNFPVSWSQSGFQVFCNQSPRTVHATVSLAGCS